MESFIWQTYRDAEAVENHVFSVQNLIRFYTFSDAIDESLAIVFRAGISKIYQGTVGRAKKSRKVHWETYKILRLFRGGHWNADSFVGAGCTKSFDFGILIEKSLHRCWVWAGGERPHHSNGGRTGKKQLKYRPVLAGER